MRWPWSKAKPPKWNSEPRYETMTWDNPKAMWQLWGACKYCGLPMFIRWSEKKPSPDVEKYCLCHELNGVVR